MSSGGSGSNFRGSFERGSGERSGGDPKCGVPTKKPINRRRPMLYLKLLQVLHLQPMESPREGSKRYGCFTCLYFSRGDHVFRDSYYR